MKNPKSPYRMEWEKYLKDLPSIELDNGITITQRELLKAMSDIENLAYEKFIERKGDQIVDELKEIFGFIDEEKEIKKERFELKIKIDNLKFLIDNFDPKEHMERYDFESEIRESNDRLGIYVNDEEYEIDPIEYLKYIGEYENEYEIWLESLEPDDCPIYQDYLDRLEYLEEKYKKLSI